MKVRILTNGQSYKVQRFDTPLTEKKPKWIDCIVRFDDDGFPDPSVRKFAYHYQAVRWIRKQWGESAQIQENEWRPL